MNHEANVRTYVPGPSVRRPFRCLVECDEVGSRVADCRRWALAVAALVSITSLITRAEGIIDESNILIVQIQQILTVRLESAERFLLRAALAEI